ncbi:MAG: hypothetical protein D4R43_01185, partial [Sphingobacteriales bacterium]
MIYFAAMNKKFLSLLIIFSIISIFFSCKTGLKGSLKENLAPETHTIIDTIIRVGADRMNAQVQLQWWGDDADGFIKGYEFTFDSVITSSTVWNFTTKQDSTFILSIPPGKDTVDFTFYVRAIDNLNVPDPTPSRLGLPVKNSAPSVAFVSGTNNPIISFPVVKFYWKGTDPDGEENLLRYELCWNDTAQTPYALDVSVSSGTFMAATFNINNPACSVYANNDLTAQATLMNGILLNDTNRLFIRAVDKSEAKSSYISSYNIFIKKPSSTTLLVEGYSSPVQSATALTFYSQNMITAGVTAFDTLNIFQQQAGVYTQLAPDNLTQARIFSLFHGIIWFSNDASKSLSLGQRTLDNFFNAGGKLFVAVYVSSSFDEQSTFLDFTPAQSLVAYSDTALILSDTSSVFAQQAGYPNLKTNTIISNVKPFNLFPGAVPIYNANLIGKKISTNFLFPWSGASTIMAYKTNQSGQVNFIFSSLELQKIDG